MSLLLPLRAATPTTRCRRCVLLLLAVGACYCYNSQLVRAAHRCSSSCVLQLPLLARSSSRCYCSSPPVAWCCCSPPPVRVVATVRHWCVLLLLLLPRSCSRYYCSPPLVRDGATVRHWCVLLLLLLATAPPAACCYCYCSSSPVRDTVAHRRAVRVAAARRNRCVLLLQFAIGVCCSPLLLPLRVATAAHCRCSSRCCFSPPPVHVVAATVRHWCVLLPVAAPATCCCCSPLLLPLCIATAARS